MPDNPPQGPGPGRHGVTLRRLVRVVAALHCDSRCRRAVDIGPRSPLARHRRRPGVIGDLRAAFKLLHAHPGAARPAAAAEGTDRTGPRAESESDGLSRSESILFGLSVRFSQTHPVVSTIVRNSG
jgi:hypothetical protein